MITKIIIDGQEFNTPARNFKFTFTTAGTHKVEYITDDGIVPANLLRGCKNLKSVNLKNTVKEIKAGAFASTGLASLNVPKTVEKIDLSSIEDCKDLNNIQFGAETAPLIIGNLPEGVKVYVPKAADNTYTNALLNANIIKEGEHIISVRTSNLYILNYYKSSYYSCHVIESKHRVWGSLTPWESIPLDDLSLSMDWTEADYEYLWKMSTAVLPDNWWCNNSYGIKEVNLLTGIERIGRFTFLNVQGMTKITLGEDVKYIDYAGISACKQLTTIEAGGQDMTFEMDKAAIYSNPLLTKPIYLGYKVYFPENCEDPENNNEFVIEEGIKEVYIDWSVKNINKITLPSTCEYLNSFTHDWINIRFNAGLKHIEYFRWERDKKDAGLQDSIPDGVEYLHIDTKGQFDELPSACTEFYSHMYDPQDHVLMNNKVLAAIPRSTSGKYIIPDGIEFVAGSVFQETGVTEIVIPNSVKQWHSGFYNSPLKHIEFPSNLEYLSTGALFQHCELLESIDFPECVEEIGGQMLGYCTNLKTITFRNPNKVVQNGNYYGSATYQWGSHKLDTLYVPASLVEQYKDTSKVSWSQWTKQILPIPE